MQRFYNLRNGKRKKVKTMWDFSFFGKYEKTKRREWKFKLEMDVVSILEEKG
jgi:hypothetical protein